MLSEKTRAIMTNRLHVPAIIEDIVSGREELTDELEFSLHDLISDMQPDTALLCIASSAQKIASSYILASPSMHVMTEETERMIEDYADLWVQNAMDKDIDEHSAIDALSNIAEDLECLSDLLQLNLSFLKAKDAVSARLFTILQIQALAHQMIADEFFKAMTLALGEPEFVSGLENLSKAGVLSAQTQKVAKTAKKFTQNVIQFPGKQDG